MNSEIEKDLGISFENYEQNKMIKHDEPQIPENYSIPSSLDIDYKQFINCHYCNKKVMSAQYKSHLKYAHNFCQTCPLTFSRSELKNH